MAKLNIVEAINLALNQEMTKDKDVVILGEDVGVDGGVFRVTDGLFKKFPNRVFDTPLAESGIIGAAIGMAIYGLKPVAEVQFSGFMYPGFDQLISHASRIRTRSRGKYSCPIVIRTPCGGGIRALEHHSESTEAIFIHTPGLKVVEPSNPYDAKGLLISSIKDPDPVIFFEPMRVYRAIKQEVPEEEYNIELGKANVVKEGNDLTIITWGAMVRDVLKINEEIKNKYDIEIIDLRTLSPFDIDAIITSVKKTGRALVVHEAPKTLGLGAEIVAQINEKALLSLEAPVFRVTGFDTIFPLAKLENYYLPTNRIKRGIEKVMNF